MMQFAVSGDQLLPIVLLEKYIAICSDKQKGSNGYMKRVLIDNIKSVEVRQASIYLPQMMAAVWVRGTKS